jgi:hypothetical protein
MIVRPQMPKVELNVHVRLRGIVNKQDGRSGRFSLPRVQECRILHVAVIKSMERTLIERLEFANRDDHGRPLFQRLHFGTLSHFAVARVEIRLTQTG